MNEPEPDQHHGQRPGESLVVNIFNILAVVAQFNVFSLVFYLVWLYWSVFGSRSIMQQLDTDVFI